MYQIPGQVGGVGWGFDDDQKEDASTFIKLISQWENWTTNRQERKEQTIA